MKKKIQLAVLLALLPMGVAFAESNAKNVVYINALSGSSVDYTICDTVGTSCDKQTLTIATDSSQNDTYYNAIEIHQNQKLIVTKIDDISVKNCTFDASAPGFNAISIKKIRIGSERDFKNSVKCSLETIAE